MVSEASGSSLVINTDRNRVKIFYKVYKRLIIILIIPIILMPIVFIDNFNAYFSLYVFLISSTYWALNVLHPAVTSLVPITFYTLSGSFDIKIITAIHVRNSALDCLGVMMIIIAMENSNVDKRLALKALSIFGTSHFRSPTPTAFTIFYFLGITYSSTIGGLASVYGSMTNQLFMNCYETIFPLGPKMEFPHFILLTLPGVLIMETLLYLWMNFYFLGMLRVHNYTTLQASLTGAEALYVKTVLATKYEELGKIKFNEMVVCFVIVLTAVLQIVVSSTCLGDHKDLIGCSALKTSAPSIICVLILFVTPVNLNCFKFCKRQNPSKPSPVKSGPVKTCLSWSTVSDKLSWSVLFVTVGCNITFEALKESAMTDEFEKFLSLFSEWPPAGVALVVIIFCKICTEFACNTTVVYCLFYHIARLSVLAKIDPRYLMVAAGLTCCMSFHLITATPANAMVSSYVHIPPRKMMVAGIGPTVAALVIILFTVCVWTRVIWPDINNFPDWAQTYFLITKDN